MLDPDYHLFARVVQAGSLSAAGRALNISPAVASKRLARLEARLGARLVHRTTRRLSLTRTGEVFHADVLAILAAAQAAEARAAGREGQAVGSLRVTCPTSFGRLHVAPHLAGFLDAHPRVEFDLDLSDGFVDLLAARFDLAIRIAPKVARGLGFLRLGDSRRVLCAAPSYLARHEAPASIADLQQHALLAAEDQLPWRLQGPEGPVQIAGASRIRTNSSEAVRELALAGGGIALRSLWDVGLDIAQGRLDRVLPAYQGSADVGVFAVHADKPAPPAASALIVHLRAAYAAQPPWGAFDSSA